MEETNLRIWHKTLLAYLRVIPMLLAFVYALNTFLSYYGIDWPILSYIGGVSILPLAFLYIASYSFRFCEYHRMFLHYVTFNWVLNIYDYYIGIPLSERYTYSMYLVIAVVFLFLILYYHRKARREGRLYNFFF